MRHRPACEDRSRSRRVDATDAARGSERLYAYARFPFPAREGGVLSIAAGSKNLRFTPVSTTKVHRVTIHAHHRHATNAYQ